MKYVLMREGLEIRQVQNQREAVDETLAAAVGELLEDWAREKQYMVQQQKQEQQQQHEDGERWVEGEEQQQGRALQQQRQVREDEEQRGELKMLGQEENGELRQRDGREGKQQQMQEQQQQMQVGENQGTFVTAGRQRVGAVKTQHDSYGGDGVEKLIVVVSDATAHTGLFHVARDAGVVCIAVCSKKRLFFGARLTLDWNKICSGEYMPSPAS
jgi:hypothetical protein